MYNTMNVIIEYIDSCLKEDISLDSVASKFHYSKTHISRMFNKVVGISLTEYVSRRRLSEAVLMLIYTDKPIQYISDVLRFGSSKYFSTVFKKEYGISPSIYRKNQSYIYLYPKRMIKGGKGMDKRNENELLNYIVSNSSTQDELLDTLSLLDNVFMYEQNNSEVKLIGIIEVMKERMVDLLVQIELNLISGKHFFRPIFSTVNSPYVKMQAVYKDEDNMKVVFAKEEKTITANIFPIGDTDFEVMVHTEIKDVYDSALDEEFPKKHINVQEFSEKILGVKNNLELEEIINQNKNLLKLKSFINEYALIYMTYTEKTLALFSIFIDLEKKRYRQVNVFTTPNRYANLSFRKEIQYAAIYNNETLLARAEIYANDLSPTYALEFPNGSTGTGGWNLTNMFKQL